MNVKNIYRNVYPNGYNEEPFRQYLFGHLTYDELMFLRKHLIRDFVNLSTEEHPF